MISPEVSLSMRWTIDAVDDAGPLLAADAGERVAAVVQQRVDQRAVRMAGGRVYHQTAGLVDDDHVAVLIYHVKRDILRHKRDIRKLGQGDKKPVARGRKGVLLHGLPAQQNRAALDQALHGTAGKTLQMASEESVDSLSALLCRDNDNIVVHVFT